MRKKKTLTYEESHKTINNIKYKKCSYHEIFFPDENEWMLCTEEYFYKNNKNNIDGLFPYCKKCSRKKADIWIKNNPYKYEINYKRYNANPPEQTVIRNRLNGKRQRENGYQKEYRKTHKDKMNQYSQNRQHKNHKITKEEWKDCKEYFNNQCAYCGLPIEEHYNTYKGKLILTDFHKEHVDDDGASDLSNCIPSCKNCNSQKWKFEFKEWYNSSNIIYNKDRKSRILKWLNEDYKKYIINKC